MNEYKYAEFGNRLKTLREQKSIKQGKFAEKVGISRQSIGNYESGKQYPTIEILIKMADCLDCSLDYLLGRTDESGAPISKLDTESLSRLRHFLDMLAKDEAEYLAEAIGMTFYSLAQNKQNPQRESFIECIAEIHYTLAECIEQSTKHSKQFSNPSGENEPPAKDIVSALMKFDELNELHKTIEAIKDACYLSTAPFLADAKQPQKRKKVAPNTNIAVKKLTSSYSEEG